MFHIKNNTSQQLLSLGSTLPALFFIFFAIWTILCHLAIVFALPYSILPLFFCITLGCSVFVYLGCAQNLLNDGSDLTVTSKNTRVDIIACLYLMILLIALLPVIKSLNYIWLWVMLVAALGLIYLRMVKRSNGCLEFSQADVSPIVTLLCLGVCTIVVGAVTIFSMRYDADDSFYLSIVVQALETPHLPTLYYESLNGLTDTLMPIKRRVCTYELLVAAFAKLTMLDHLTVYYVIFPALSCIVFIWLFFGMYKRLLITEKAAIVAVIALIILLLCWGDGHRTYGNFSFVRFFQGKSLLIQIFVPAAVYFAIQSIIHRRSIYLILLGFTLIGASGVSVNGILVAPLAVILVLLGAAFVTPERIFNYSCVTRFFLVLFYPLLVACVVKINPGGEYIQYFGSSHFPERFSNSYEVLGTVIGNMSHKQSFNFRTVFILASILTLPLFIPQDYHKKLFFGYIALTLALIFFPDYPVQKFLAEHASRNLMWRLTWVVPFVFIAACTIGAIMNSQNKKLYLLIPLLLFTFMFADENWTISKGNKNHWALQLHKYNPTILEQIEVLRPLLPPDGLLIAPEWMTVVMSSLLDLPPLPIVRAMYLERYDINKKRELKILSHGVHSYLDRDAVKRFWEIVDKRNISSIILYRPKGVEGELMKLFTENQFEMRHKIQGLVLWVDTRKDSPGLVPQS